MPVVMVLLLKIFQIIYKLSIYYFNEKILKIIIFSNIIEWKI
jgi:hypothetical protein